MENGNVLSWILQLWPYFVVAIIIYFGIKVFPDLFKSKIIRRKVREETVEVMEDEALMEAIEEEEPQSRRFSPSSSLRRTKSTGEDQKKEAFEQLLTDGLIGRPKAEYMWILALVVNAGILLIGAFLAVIFYLFDVLEIIPLFGGVTFFLMFAVTIYINSKYVFRVDERFEVVVTNLGKYHKIVGAGLHVFVPLWREPWRRIDKRPTTIDFKPRQLRTKDNVRVVVDPTASVVVINSYNLVYTSASPKDIVSWLNTALSSFVQSVTYDELTDLPDNLVPQQRLQAINKILRQYGLRILELTIEASEPVDEVTAAALETARTAKTEAAAIRTRADAEADATRIMAQAEADAMTMKADAEAYLRQTLARANTEIIEQVATKLKSITGKEVSPVEIQNMLQTIAQQIAAGGAKEVIAVLTGASNRAEQADSMAQLIALMQQQKEKS